jgi:hypothetical protein
MPREYELTSGLINNQQGTPIEPTERRLLRSRGSASAVAARAITHAGTGHRYWGAFPPNVQKQIEGDGKDIYKALYDPPITGMPLTTLDVPVAGRGYNALPFVFDLVNQANNVRTADSTVKLDIRDTLPLDHDGATTVEYLRTVRKRIDRITGDTARSLGLHPIIYFYTRSGTFQPTVFLAVSDFLEELVTTDKLIMFTVHRRSFEEFQIMHKEATSILIKQLGSGARHIPRLRGYYHKILDGLVAGQNLDDIQAGFAGDPNYAFLVAPRPIESPPEPAHNKRTFSRGTKTAAFFETALPKGPRCGLCGALIHRNSVQFDHIVDRRSYGTADISNAQVTHPFCNSVKDHLRRLIPSLATSAPAKVT